MIVNRAYSGKKIVYRAYYNEQLIWDYGKCNRGNAFASLEASMMPYLASQDSAQMLASALMDGFVNAEVSDFENIMAHANMSARTNVAPYALSPIQIAGTEFITVRASIVPFTFDIVCARGDATMKLSAYGYHDEIPVVHGSGIAKVKHINSLCPTLEDVVQILGTSKESINDFVIPKSQEPELIATDLSSNFIVNGSPIVSPIHTVTFMHDGALLYRTKVIEGYDCPNPVTTHVITAPTKEMTVQHTYKFSGWSMTDGGPVVDEVTSVYTETQLDGFTYNENFRAYILPVNPAPFTLQIGEMYTVTWDNVTYKCIAQDLSAMQEGSIGLGNLSNFGGSGNNEPFIIGWSSSGVTYMSYTNDISHRIEIKKEPALNNITADTVVYAAFTESIRYYTVRFFDGQTLVDTVSVPYGGTAVTSYTKPGYKTTWYPSNENITGDTDCYGQFDRITFASGTWAEIKAICDAGNAATYFSVGEKKPITLNYADGTSETINFTIVDMNVQPLSLWSSDKAPLTIMADNIVAISPTKVHSTSSSGSIILEGNIMKPFLNSIFEALPEELQGVIRECDGNVASFNTYKIFLAGFKNYGISSSYSGINSASYNNTYKHFKNGATIKRTKLADPNYDTYWVIDGKTTSSYSATGMFGVIDGTKNMSTLQGATASYGVVPCFCV